MVYGMKGYMISFYAGWEWLCFSLNCKFWNSVGGIDVFVCSSLTVYYCCQPRVFLSNVLSRLAQFRVLLRDVKWHFFIPLGNTARATLSGGGLIIEFERKQVGARVIMLSLVH